jgi:hypothetical protein
MLSACGFRDVAGAHCGFEQARYLKTTLQALATPRASIS